MGTHHYAWIPGKEPPRLQSHSIAKHDVLRAYLERYVEVLTGDPRQDTLRLTLVDGFAGGGIYADDRTGELRPGSPLIMLEAMQVAEARAKESRKKEFHLDARFFFLDKDPRTLQFLKQTLERSCFSGLVNERAILLNGTFKEQLPRIMEDIRARGSARRAIFLLDQYGYSDVPMRSLQAILEQLPNAEIILTFAADWLIDYLSDNLASQKILASLGVELSSEAIRKAKGEQPKNWRHAIQLLLHDEIHMRSGARYYTPFFIDCPESHRAYWLVHLSGHARARDVMTELHWAKYTHFAHYGRPGLRMLGYDPLQDSRLTGQKAFAAFHFDRTARELTEEALIDELPARIAEHRDGISFQNLFAETTNETPATSTILREVLESLAREGDVEIRGKDGSIRRKGSVIRKSDVLLVPRQARLFPSRVP